MARLWSKIPSRFIHFCKTLCTMFNVYIYVHVDVCTCMYMHTYMYIHVHVSNNLL